MGKVLGQRWAVTRLVGTAGANRRGDAAVKGIFERSAPQLLKRMPSGAIPIADALFSAVNAFERKRQLEEKATRLGQHSRRLDDQRDSDFDPSQLS